MLQCDRGGIRGCVLLIMGFLLHSSISRLTKVEQSGGLIGFSCSVAVRAVTVTSASDSHHA